MPALLRRQSRVRQLNRQSSSDGASTSPSVICDGTDGQPNRQRTLNMSTPPVCRRMRLPVVAAEDATKPLPTYAAEDVTANCAAVPVADMEVVNETAPPLIWSIASCTHDEGNGSR